MPRAHGGGVRLRQGGAPGAAYLLQHHAHADGRRGRGDVPGGSHVRRRQLRRRPRLAVGGQASGEDLESYLTIRRQRPSPASAGPPSPSRAASPAPAAGAARGRRRERKTPGPRPARQTVGVYAVNAARFVEGDGTLSGPLDTDNFPAGEITWNNRPAADATPLDTAVVGASGSYSWDVTAAVERAVAAGRASVTFALAGQGGEHADRLLRLPRIGQRAGADRRPDRPPPPALADGGGLARQTSRRRRGRADHRHYDAPAGLDLSSLGPDNLRVTGPSGTRGRSGRDRRPVRPDQRAGRLHARRPRPAAGTQRMTATYQVSVVPGQVFDLAGNAVPQTSAKFKVSIPVPTPAPSPTPTPSPPRRRRRPDSPTPSPTPRLRRRHRPLRHPLPRPARPDGGLRL